MLQLDCVVSFICFLFISYIKYSYVFYIFGSYKWIFLIVTFKWLFLKIILKSCIDFLIFYLYPTPFWTDLLVKMKFKLGLLGFEVRPHTKWYFCFLFMTIVDLLCWLELLSGTIVNKNDMNSISFWFLILMAALLMLYWFNIRPFDLISKSLFVLRK